MNGRYLFGIGLVLMVLSVFAAPAAANNVLRIEPSEIGCASDEEVTNVRILLNATDTVVAFQVHLKYAGDVVDIVNVTHAEEIGTNPDWIIWDAQWVVDDAVNGDGHLYLFITGLLFSGVIGDNIEIGNITLKGMSPGTQLLELNGWSPDHDPCQIVGVNGEHLDLYVVHANFTCAGPLTTFTKSLAPGWNLISLPLTPSDNSVSAVLGGVSYSAVYGYDATSKEFECPDMMDPGTGYFVDVTSASTWEYGGTPVHSTSPGLKSGLNMFGVPNCVMSVSDAMGPADYRYVAR